MKECMNGDNMELSKQACNFYLLTQAEGPAAIKLI